MTIQKTKTRSSDGSTRCTGLPRRSTPSAKGRFSTLSDEVIEPL